MSKAILKFNDDLQRSLKKHFRTWDVTSLHGAAELHGVGYTTVEYRLRNGWDVRQAFGISPPPTKDPRLNDPKTYLRVHGYKTLKEAAADRGLNYHTVVRRLGEEWPINAALETPAQGVPRNAGDTK